jgi:glucose-1-phosphate thymidylyltransferase
VKGVILAGGSGQRLHPLTRITNKHLLPVYDRPMIYFAVQALANAGLDRIMIVTGGNHAGEFLRLLGNGAEFGLRHLDYAYQEHPGGIAQALGLAEHYAAGDAVVVLLGDNIFEYSIRPIVERFQARPTGARVVLAEVDDPRSYGVAEFEGERLVRVVEKPRETSSHWIVTGLYLYDGRVFDVVRTLKPSGRGELELTDVNNHYLGEDRLEHEKVRGYWADCGESIAKLHAAGDLVAARGANKPFVEAGNAG